MKNVNGAKVAIGCRERDSAKERRMQTGNGDIRARGL